MTDEPTYTVVPSPNGDVIAFQYLGVEVILGPSSGVDGGVIVMIDTDFEPDGSDGGPGLLVSINDDDTYVGVAYEPDPS